MERIDKLEKELYGLSNAVSQIVQLLQVSDQTPNNSASQNTVDTNVDTNENSWNLSANKNAAKPAQRTNDRPLTTTTGRLWSVGRSFMLQTTIHGVSNAVSTKRLVLRILWLFMIFVSALFCVYTIYSTTSEYLEYDVITKTEQQQEQTVTFPAVILCAQEGERFIKNLNPLEVCRFNEADCSRATDIDTFSSDRIVDNKNYECIRFNGFGANRNGSLKSIQDETGEQLWIRLMDGGQGRNEYHLTMKRLIFIVQDNYLNTLEFSKFYYIQKEDNFKVYVTKAVDEKLGTPWNQCHKMDAAYRQLNCIERCKHEKVAVAYNCSLRGFYRMQEYGGLCKNPVVKKRRYQTVCEEGCPRECDVTEYSVSILPGVVNSNQAGKIVIFAAFQSMRHLKISQIAKTSFWDLLSSLGGTLGFLGMSFLTFVEIFEFILEIFMNLFA